MKNYAYNTLLVIAMAISLPYHAQRTNEASIDSLLKVVPETSSDTTKINLFNRIAWQYMITNRASKALPFIEDALALSQDIEFTRGEAVAWNYLGVYYQMQSKYADAFNSYLKSIEMNEKANYPYGIAFANQSVGVIYYIQGNYEEAISYYEIAKAIYERIGDNRGIGYIYSNIANCYSEIAQYDKALENYQSALSIFTGLQSIGGASIQNSLIGETYMRMGRYEEALASYELAMYYAREENRKNLIISAYIGLGQVKTLMKRYESARKDIIGAMALMKDFGSRNNYAEAYAVLTKLDSAGGQWKDAYTNHLLHIAYRDSVKNEETTKQTIEAQMKYSFDQRAAEVRAEQDKKDLRQSIIRNVSFGGLFFAMIFSLVVYRQRNRISKEKKTSETLLLNILPADIAEELKQNGQAEARTFDRVSVLFTDFKAFTEVAEKMTAKELVSEINICFQAFDSVMIKYGVEKIKTIGDAYMAAGGLPKPTEDSVKNTVLAGLEIQDFVTHRKAKREEYGLKAFDMRVGIHTGPVVAGIVGRTKFQYDIWGDTVNTASRLESTGEVGRLNISKETYELIKDDLDFLFEERGLIEAKGKGLMEMYFVSLA